jgi:uncharacterized protein (DUF2147 family)
MSWAMGRDMKRTPSSRCWRRYRGTKRSTSLRTAVRSCRSQCCRGLLNSVLGVLGGFFVLAAMWSTALAADPQGVWLTEDKDAVLTITNCGGQLCGRIIWLESATDLSGSLLLDQNNPDPAKKTQRICGLVVMSGIKPSGPDTWDGYVYNPQDGNTYSGNITVLSDQALKLRAYVGLPIFGRSETWTRVTSPAANGIEYSCRSHG